MQELTVKTNTTGTTTILGNWELRAGSHDTTEWLDGAADVSYPGGGPGTFHPANSDGATGYDPAPKMALLSMTQAGNSGAVTLEGGDLNGVYALFGTQTDGTPGTSDLKLATSNVAADSDSDDIKEVTITATSTGGLATAVLQIMMLYY